MSQAKDQDQSMEEILQSIKRIIAEEGTPAGAGSDVLELTDMLGDEPETSMPHAMPAADMPALDMSAMSIDDIMAAPLASGAAAEPLMPPVFTPAPAPMPIAMPAPEPVAMPAPMPAPTATMPAPAPQAQPAPTDEPLVSVATRAAATAALAALSELPAPPLAAIQAGMGFRSGNTVEDLVLEALKPMLKDWLDANLAGLVERLVEKEVRRLSQR